MNNTQTDNIYFLSVATKFVLKGCNNLTMGTFMQTLESQCIPVVLGGVLCLFLRSKELDDSWWPLKLSLCLIIE